jgi:hypothetical protein
LSVNARVPEAVPPAVGVKVSATAQEPDAATGLEVEQVVPEVAIAKGPVTLIAANVRLALPVLVTVMVSAGLVVPTGSDGKVGGADKPTRGPVPVPVKLTVCGLGLALSAIVTDAVRVPVAVGVNVTSIVQLPPPETDPLHAFVWEKSPALAPVMFTPVTVRVAVPVLESVTGSGALEVSINWSEKLRLVGDSAMVEAASYSSALERKVLPFTPPATSTLPLPNKAARAFVRIAVILAVTVKVPATGSYNSASEK